jgi:uncharacterized membrane protein YagU involved in acid resistance
MDVMIAVIAGLTGTTIMTGMMLVIQRLGLPAIDVHGLLGYITREDRRSSLGYISHWVLGVIFAIPYIWLFRVSLGNVVLLGAVLGIAHWMLVGGMFAFAPMIHAGMKAGTVKVPGAYMAKSMGLLGFIGGMIGHIVFGVTVALIYLWLG